MISFSYKHSIIHRGAFNPLKGSPLLARLKVTRGRFQVPHTTAAVQVLLRLSVVTFGQSHFRTTAELEDHGYNQDRPKYWKHSAMLQRACLQASSL